MVSRKSSPAQERLQQAAQLQHEHHEGGCERGRVPSVMLIPAIRRGYMRR